MWGDVGMSAGGGGHMKLENGESVKLHVLGEAEGAPAEPKSYFQYFNNAVQRGVVLPEGFKDSSIKAAAKHSVLVWSFKDEAVRIWSMGNTVAAQLKGVMEGYDNGLADCDITLKRVGADKKTKYILTPKNPSVFDASVLEGVELPDLETIFAANTEEEVEGLKDGIVPDNDGTADAASDEETVAAEAQAAADAEAAGEEVAPEDDEDEAAKLEAQLAALKAKKTAKAAPPKVAPKAAAPKPQAAGDPRMALVKAITHSFATNAKYKTPAARIAVIKAVTKTKTTLSACTLPELQTLSKKIK